MHERVGGAPPDGDQPFVRHIWKALYAADAEVVVGAHDHDYERFAPQRLDGTRDAERGIRQFVVGTGGDTQHGFGGVQLNSQARNASTPGVLKLTLDSGS